MAGGEATGQQKEDEGEGVEEVDAEGRELVIGVYKIKNEELLGRMKRW